MSRLLKAFRIVVAAAVAIAMFWLLSPKSDKRVINGLIEQARSIAEVSGKEPVFEAFGKAKRLSEFVSHALTVTLPGGEVVSFPEQKQLQQRIAAGRAAFSSLEIAVRNISVQVEGNQAHVQLTVSALGAQPGIEGQFLEIHTLALELVKINGRWLVQKAFHIRNERERSRG